MTDSNYVWPARPTITVAVRGGQQRCPVNRLFFVGRNYHAHAIEMGRPVDKSVDSPFYFTKSPSTLVPSGTSVPYPPATHDYQYEMELVVVIGAAGFRIDAREACKLIFGYACGLDMTRRDLQLAARDKGRPWDVGKDVEHSSIISEIVSIPGVVLDRGEISLSVNGQVRQSSRLEKLIWSVPELIADLSRYYHLEAGDLIFTGTPEGVGPLHPGDRLEGRIERVGSIELAIGSSFSRLGDPASPLQFT
jgi:fumarylpyruvate hydrolase